VSCTGVTMSILAFHLLHNHNISLSCGPQHSLSTKVSLKKHGHYGCVTADLSPTASLNGSIASTIASCGMQFVKASSIFESRNNGQCLVPIRGALGAGKV